MKTHLIKAVIILVLASFLGSCSISNQSMKTPNYHIEFYKSDFEYSEQVSAEATSVRVLGIDWKRLFRWDNGTMDSDLRGKDPNYNVNISGAFNVDNAIGSISTIVPVLGDYGKGKVSSYALYNLMQENPGYDLVIYPQYETKKFIVPIFYSKRVVKVTARLGKIKSEE